MKTFFICGLLVAAMCSGHAAAAAASPQADHATSTAEVIALTLADAIDGLPVDVICYLRDGMPFNGYALVRGMPAVPHPISFDPPGRIRFVDAGSGEAIPLPPSMLTRYGYNNPTFARFRDQWRAGAISVQRVDDPAPLRQGDDGGWAGTIDLIIPRNGLGNGEDIEHRCLRVQVDLSPQGTGRWHGRWYEWDDIDRGGEEHPLSGNASWEARPDHWTADPEDHLAAGRDWPQANGPTGGMSAVDCHQDLVHNISDARLQWVAEDRPGGSKGAVQKTAFGAEALVANDPEHGGYASPVVADGRVFLVSIFPDLDRIVSDPRWRDDIQRLRGGPLGSVAYGQLVDRLVAIDAATGRSLWKVEYPFTNDNLRDEKGGRGISAAVAGDVVVWRGGRGLYGHRVSTGELLWHHDRHGLGSSGTRQSKEESIIIIDGVALYATADERGPILNALDPATGAALWDHPFVNGSNALPVPIELDGKWWVLCAASDVTGMTTPESARNGRLSLIDPQTGAIQWQSSLVGPCPNSLVVEGDVVLGQARQDLPPKGRELESGGWLGAWRVTLQGAEPLWEQPGVNVMQGRNTPTGHHGSFIIDSRTTGFSAVSIADGSILGRLPSIHQLAGGDHNWSWCLASDGRVLTNGLLQFSSQDLRPMPGHLPIRAASGYLCPIKPAIADGRLFMRTKHHLVCYDLRSQYSDRSRAEDIQLALYDAWIGVPQAPLRLHLRQRDGHLFPDAAVFLPTDEEAGLPYGKARRHATWQPNATAGLSLHQGSIAGSMALDCVTDQMPISLAVDVASGGQGVWRRRIDAMDAPRPVDGRLSGAGPMPRQIATPWLKGQPFTPMGTNPPGTQTWMITLHGLLPEDAPLTIYLDHDGTRIVRAAATALSWVTAWHEVDASDLTISEQAISGNLMVILHSDPWRAVVDGAGPQVAASLQIDATIDAEQVSGTWAGTLGLAWEASGRVAVVQGSAPAAHPEP